MSQHLLILKIRVLWNEALSLEAISEVSLDQRLGKLLL